VLREILASTIASVTGVSPDSTDNTIRQRLRAVASSSLELSSHFGIGRDRCWRCWRILRAAAVWGVFIVVLLPEGNHRLFIAHSHLDCITARADRELPIAEPADEVKGLAWGLLAGQAQGVRGDRRLDRRAHGRRRAKEPIGRCEPVQGLVRALEVVVLHEQQHSALTVLVVRKHRAREELLPHRLPESLDLPARLRMVGAALHVLDAVPTQLRLKLRRPAPGRVLPSLVRQNLPWRAVLGNAAGQRLEHQRAPLVVGDRQAHEIARVIVQERRHIEPLVPAQQERE
jgi:hypothetical protein